MIIPWILNNSWDEVSFIGMNLKLVYTIYTWESRKLRHDTPVDYWLKGDWWFIASQFVISPHLANVNELGLQDFTCICGTWMHVILCYSFIMP